MYFQLVFDIPADQVAGGGQRALRLALSNLVSDLGLGQLTPYNDGDEHPALSRERRNESADRVIDSVMAVFSGHQGDGLMTLDDGFYMSASRDSFDGDIQLQLEVRDHAASLARFVRTSGLRITRPYRRFTLIERLLQRVPLLRLIDFDVRLNLLLTESSRGAPTRRATKAARRDLMHEAVRCDISDVTHFVTASNDGASVLLEWASRTTRRVLRNPLWRFRHARHLGPAPRWEAQLATKRVAEADGTHQIVAAALFIGNAAFVAENPPCAEYAGGGVQIEKRLIG